MPGKNTFITMVILALFTGIIIGIGVAYLVLNLWGKTRNVSKHAYDQLNSQFNESNILLKVHEEKLSAQNTTITTLVKSNESRQSENQDLQKEIFAMHKTLAEESADKRSLSHHLQSEKENVQELRDQLQSLHEEIRKISSENSSLTAVNKGLSEKLDVQKNEIIELQKKAQLEFEKIANKLFDEKSSRFTQVNKENIEALLKPLGENINSFKKKVEDTYDKESKERFSLSDRVKELIQQTNNVSAEANNLANALKGQAKKQGNWGEIILESILQQSGLEKNREYFLQQTIKDETGKSLRPDVLIKLPDNRTIIIDSKVSLVAYDRFYSAETKQEQAIHQSEHLKSIYGHIDNLHSKKYDQLDAALDFTMLFVPIEPAYLLCIQSDPDLWAYAYSKRILLISPTNLIACLKLMSDLWKREQQSRNAMEIVKRGELLYEKFVTFVSTLEDIGRYIQKTQTSYITAMAQLNTGNGHLVGQALKLKNLGLKSSKQIPGTFIPDEETEVPE